MKYDPRSHVAGLLRETSLARPIWFMRDMSETAISLITSPVLRKRRHGAAILNWHGVTRHFIDPAAEVSHISGDLFRKQIRHIQRHCRIVSLAQLVIHLESGDPIPDNWVTLTFDDGFRNNLTCAWDILQETGDIPMTIFIITDLVGTKNNHWADLIPMAVMCCHNHTLRVPHLDDSWETRSLQTRRVRANLRFEVIDTIKSMSEIKRQSVLEEFFSQFGTGELDEIRSRFPSYNYLSWDELRSMHASGVDVGSHTCTHAYMRSDLGEERMRDEIIRSRERIRDELGQSPAHFCYPNGGHQDFCVPSGRILQEAGYLCGLTTVPGLVMTGNNPLTLKRQTQVGTMARFRATVAGHRSKRGGIVALR